MKTLVNNFGVMQHQGIMFKNIGCLDMLKIFFREIIPMKKYNIALLPVDKDAAFVEVSQKFSMMDPIYNLGEKSLPHVTLCQFLSRIK